MTREGLWWKEGVIYQIYPRSFNDTRGDGLGDLRGIIEKLDYLNDGTENSLGVDAIWLSPIYPSPQKDFGYDVSDYRAIHPEYGTMEDFEELLEEAHKRNIRVILDLVLNHCSSQHPWFQESRSSKDNPKRDWFIWKDAGPGGAPPNNWKSVFGGSAWSWDEKTGQYYLHFFLPDQPDLNWRNPEVEGEIYDIVKFWLDKGVDGFRLDVFNQYYKDDQFRSNPLKRSLFWLVAGIFYSYGRYQHLYDRDQPEMMEALEKMREICDSYPERMMVGETLDEEKSFSNASQYYGDGTNALHLVFNFNFLRSSWKVKDFQEAIEQQEREIPPGGWPCYVLSNHDVKRHYSRYGRGEFARDRAKVAAAMMLTLRGTPVMYYGEELGLAEGQIPKDRLKDPLGVDYWPFYKGRDGCRTPMPWTKGEGYGFTTGDPWLPFSGNSDDVNVEKEEEKEDSLLGFYRQMIWLRKKSSALKKGSLEFVDSPSKTLAYRRKREGETLEIWLNFSSQEIRLSQSNISKRSLYFSSAKRGEDSLDLPLVLAPFEVLILSLD